MSGLHKYKPEMAMFGLQFTYACLYLFGRVALVQGMSTRVFVVYRQAIATLIIAPIAYVSRRNSNGPSMSLRSFSWIFLVSLIGVSINQNMFFEGLYLSSSSVGSAMTNTVPAITFIVAFTLGFEKIDFKSARGFAKIAGTGICVSGAISIALIKGPKLLNDSMFASDNKNWVLGCALLFGSTCCWSLWLILQVPVTASYPEPLSLTAWMCFFATIQSGIFAFFFEDASAWILHSKLEIIYILFAGMIGSGLSFFVQTWVIAQRGPVFSAVFNPLCPVIVTIFAAIFLHEDIYSGSLFGAICVIIGLYIVLWGKARDFGDANSKMEIDETQSVKIMSDEFEGEGGCKVKLKEPLLSPNNDENISSRV